MCATDNNSWIRKLSHYFTLPCRVTGFSFLATRGTAMTVKCVFIAASLSHPRGSPASVCIPWNPWGPRHPPCSSPIRNIYTDTNKKTNVGFFPGNTHCRPDFFLQTLGLCWRHRSPTPIRRPQTVRRRNQLYISHLCRNERHNCALTLCPRSARRQYMHGSPTLANVG